MKRKYPSGKAVYRKRQKSLAGNYVKAFGPLLRPAMNALGRYAQGKIAQYARGKWRTRPGNPKSESRI